MNALYMRRLRVVSPYSHIEQVTGKLNTYVQRMKHKYC